MSARMKRLGRCGGPVLPRTAGAGRCSRRYAGFIHGLLALGTALGVEGTSGGVPLAAQATGTAGDVRTLTLEEALALATEHNPRYRKALNSLDLIGGRLRQGWAAFLPSVTADYSTGQSYQRQLSYIDFLGQPTANPEPQWVVSSNSRMGLNTNLEILDGGRRYRDYQRIRAEAQSDRLSTQTSLDGILATVQREFMTVQRQEAQLALERELIAARQRDLDVTLRRYELALIDRSDVLAAQLDLQSQRAALRDAEGRVTTALISLRVAIGDPSLVSLEVAERLPEPFDPASLDLEDLVAHAVQEGPVVRAQEARVQISQASVRVESSRRWPTLTANSYWGRDAYERGEAALFDLKPGLGVGGTTGLTFRLSFPVFDRFQRSSTAASLRVNLQNANEDLREARLVVDRDIRIRFVDLTTAWETLQQRELARDIASERLQIMRQQYQLANVDIEAFRSAINEEARARRQVVDQHFGFALALLALHEAAGTVGRQASLLPEVN